VKTRYAFLVSVAFVFPWMLLSLYVATPILSRNAGDDDFFLVFVVYLAFTSALTAAYVNLVTGIRYAIQARQKRRKRNGR
jgi:hypothetical protein